MSESVQITEQWLGGSQTVQKINTYTSSKLSMITEEVADGETDYEIAFASDVSELKVLYIMSSQAVTFETNDGTTPDDTYSLTVNRPLVWCHDSYHDNPFGTDITSVFITNASGATAEITIYCLEDATP